MAESPKLPEDVKSGISKPDISDEERVALHNVTSALYNRSQVREVLDRAVADICAILQVPPPDKKGKGKKGEKKASLETSKKNEEIAEKPLQKQQEEREGSWSGEEDFEGFGEDDEVGDEKSEDESGSDAEESLDEEDSGEISSGKEEEAVGRWEAMLGSGSSDSDEEEDDESAVSDEPSAPASPPRKVARAKPSKDAIPMGADSLFLPSLMGGYISGSESASDVDVAPPARKNRRGQRARQALSELKYKDKAKHLEKAKKGRDAGWDMKRGAVAGNNSSRPWKDGIQNPLERSNNNGGDHAFNKPKRAPPKKDNEGPLHPSWEARKKAKEAQKSATFQGTKVTFD